MATNVSDSRSNSYEQIEFAVKKIGKSKDKLKVFDFIYRGKKTIKTVAEISNGVGISAKRVLEVGKPLAKNSIVKQIKVNKKIAYEKDPFYSDHKNQIINLVKNPKKLKKLPSKRNSIVFQSIEKIIVAKKQIKVKQLFIEDIDSFFLIKQNQEVEIDLSQISEKMFKLGVQKIIGEQGRFTDWGGESSDLLTTRIILHGKRTPTAFAFKGPGKKGKLTPAKMGKNGDQIQRLFKTPADLYILQYWGQIEESVTEQMIAFAKIKSIAEDKLISFCIIDGTDTKRIISAYGNKF
jgi:hypothetical protein